MTAHMFSAWALSLSATAVKNLASKIADNPSAPPPFLKINVTDLDQSRALLSTTQACTNAHTFRVNARTHTCARPSTRACAPTPSHTRQQRACEVARTATKDELRRAAIEQRNQARARHAEAVRGVVTELQDVVAQAGGHNARMRTSLNGMVA